MTWASPRGRRLPWAWRPCRLTWQLWRAREAKGIDIKSLLAVSEQNDAVAQSRFVRLLDYRHTFKHRPKLNSIGVMWRGGLWNCSRSDRVARAFECRKACWRPRGRGAAGDRGCPGLCRQPCRCCQHAFVCSKAGSICPFINVDHTPLPRGLVADTLPCSLRGRDTCAWALILLTVAIMYSSSSIGSLPACGVGCCCLGAVLWRMEVHHVKLSR